MATGLENLKIYVMAEELEIEVYRITKTFPVDERYRSVDQLRRSSSSCANVIAEGYNRHSYKEKIRYCIIAKSEAEETKRNILKCARKGFITNEFGDEIARKYTELIMAISGYVRFLNNQQKKTT